MERLVGLKRGAGTDDDRTKILVLGLQGAGKTTLLTRISGGDRTLHDMGNQKFKVRSLQTPALQCTVWDVGEDKFIDPYWSDYHYDRTTVLCFVVDASNPATLPAARKELFKVANVEKLKRIPIVIVASHQDMEGALSVVKISEALELHDFKYRAYKVFGCQGGSADELQLALEWAARWSAAGFYPGDPVESRDSLRSSAKVEQVVTQAAVDAGTTAMKTSAECRCSVS